jgi:hypothetical protein
METPRFKVLQQKLRNQEGRHTRQHNHAKDDQCQRRDWLPKEPWHFQKSSSTNAWRAEQKEKMVMLRAPFLFLLIDIYFYLPLMPESGVKQTARQEPGRFSSRGGADEHPLLHSPTRVCVVRLVATLVSTRSGPTVVAVDEMKLRIAGRMTFGEILIFPSSV